MKFELGKRYRFSGYEHLSPLIRGKEFSFLRIGSGTHSYIEVYDDNGDIILSPSAERYWIADPANSERWSDYIFKVQGKSVLEFKFV